MAFQFAFLLTSIVFTGAVTAILIQSYKALIEVRLQVDQTWSNIDRELKRGIDEIPLLAQALEKFIREDHAVIDRLLDAPRRYGKSLRRNEKVKVANEMSLALHGIIALAEGRPELRASEKFSELEARVSLLEEVLIDRRVAFNNSVLAYNTRIEQFPELFLAKLLDCRPMEQFNFVETEKAQSMGIPKAA